MLPFQARQELFSSEDTPPLSSELCTAVLNHLELDRAASELPLLGALLAAYTRTVPWESAFRIAKRARNADVSACPRWPEEFWADAIERGGGGTCFESNYAFYSLLRALGYQGYLTINNMGDSVGCHTAIIVTLAGQRWLVDAGLPLYSVIALESGQTTEQSSPYYMYTARSDGANRYQIERSPHPKPYCFTLIDQAVDDSRYRAALSADYGFRGLFLDRVIVNRVVGGHIWRFNSGEQPYHLEKFEANQRTDYPISGDVSEGVGAHFGMDVDTLRVALQALTAGEK